MLILHVLPPVRHKVRQRRKTRLLRAEKALPERHLPRHLKTHRFIQDQVQAGHRITKGQEPHVQPVAVQIRTLQITRQAGQLRQIRQLRRVQQVRQAGPVRRVHQLTVRQAGRVRVRRVRVARQAGHPARQAHPEEVHVRAAAVVDNLVIIN